MVNHETCVDFQKLGKYMQSIFRQLVITMLMFNITLFGNYIHDLQCEVNRY